MLAEAVALQERRLEGLRRLESLLSFRLAIMQKLLDRQVAGILADHDMPLATFRVLITIEAFGEIAAAELVRTIALDKAAVSRTCAELSRAGLIAQRADPTNARRRLMSLTEAGAARLARVRPDVDARNAALEALFSAEERAVIDSAVDRLTAAALEDETARPPGAHETARPPG